MSAANVRRSIVFGLSAGLASCVVLLACNISSRPAIPDLATLWPTLVFVGLYSGALAIAGAFAHAVTQATSRSLVRFLVLAASTSAGGLVLGTVASIASFSFRELSEIAFPQNVLLLALVCTSAASAALDIYMSRRACETDRATDPSR